MSAARSSVIVRAASAVVLSIAVFSLASVSAAEISAPRPGSVYIPMPDGTRLAADLWWPPESALQTKVPAVVSTGDLGPSTLRNAMPIRSSMP